MMYGRMDNLQNIEIDPSNREITVTSNGTKMHNSMLNQDFG